MNDRDDVPVEREIAKRTNGQVWNLIEQGSRTAAEDRAMLRLAHTSAYHWGDVGGPHEWTRAEWLVSRVYVLLGGFDDALWHAERALDLCVEHGIGDFDLAYGHEAVARAAAGAGLETTARTERAAATAAAEAIADPEDRRIFADDFAAEPWFGVT